MHAALRQREPVLPADCLLEDAPGSTQVERSVERFHVLDSADRWTFVRTCRCGHTANYAAKAAYARCRACGRALGE